MKVGKRYRGTLQRCLMQYVKDKLDNRESIVSERIFVIHTAINTEIIKPIIDAISQEEIFNNIYETNVGCTVSSHCGPNTLGILYIQK